MKNDRRVKNMVDEETLVPPTPLRVAQRALVLAGVTCRGFIERDIENEPLRQRVIAWLNALGLVDELEPDEASLLTTPVGHLTQQQGVDAGWRCEGLVVLAWALGSHDLPAHDESVHPEEVADILGFLDAAPSALGMPTLRPQSELQRCSDLFLALHWRLREFSLSRKPIDFVSSARTAWFGPLDIGELRLVEGDLAVGYLPVSAAPEAEFSRCLSIAMERHQAVNWLRGYAEVYSEVSTNT
jgi:hypothetical protein